MYHLDPKEVHREYEAMMQRPLPVWLDRTMLFVVALILGALIARIIP